MSRDAERRFEEYRRSRDPQLRDEIVRDHLELARELARRYHGRGVEHEDLAQVAALGLVKAVERFDPGRGASFSAFAVPTILGELRHHLRDRAAAIRIPRRLQALDHAIRRTAEELRQERGREPRLDEIAARIGANIDDVVRAVASRSPRTHVAEADGYEDLGAALALERIVDREELRSAVARLDERRRRILLLRFEHEWTQSRIAEHVGVSQVHVSRLLSSTLERLRQDLSAG